MILQYLLKYVIGISVRTLNSSLKEASLFMELR